MERDPTRAAADPDWEIEQQQQCHENREKKLVSVSCQAFRSRESIICGPGETGERVANKDKESSQEVISIQRSSQASNQFNQVQMIFLCFQITL